MVLIANREDTSALFGKQMWLAYVGCLAHYRLADMNGVPSGAYRLQTFSTLAQDAYTNCNASTVQFTLSFGVCQKLCRNCTNTYLSGMKQFIRRSCHPNVVSCVCALQGCELG